MKSFIKQIALFTGMILAFSVLSSCDPDDIEIKLKCKQCDQTGKCPNCDGDGIFEVKNGIGYVPSKCVVCKGSGACTNCEGKGYTVLKVTDKDEYNEDDLYFD